MSVTWGDVLLVCEAVLGDQAPPRTVERFAAAVASARRDLALCTLARLLDSPARRSIRDLARDIARRLRRFERGGAWERIRAAGRSPASALEEQMVLALQDPGCPRSPRRIADVIRGQCDAQRPGAVA